MRLSGGLRSLATSGRQNRIIGHVFRVLTMAFSSVLSVPFRVFRSRKSIRRFRPPERREARLTPLGTKPPLPASSRPILHASPFPSRPSRLLRLSRRPNTSRAAEDGRPYLRDTPRQRLAGGGGGASSSMLRVTLWEVRTAESVGRLSLSPSGETSRVAAVLERKPLRPRPQCAEAT